LENRESDGILANDNFRKGAQVLAQKGLSLDVMLSFPQLPELADFAQSLPDLTIILNHIGGINRVGMYANRDDEVMATWRSGIAAVAACPNVNVKLGGMGMPPPRVSLAHSCHSHRLRRTGSVYGSLYNLLH
jgi:L-fuconolactonase